MKRLFLALTLFLIIGIVAAQDEPVATDEPTPTVVKINAFEPAAIAAGTERTLTVFGANFTDQTTIRLVGIGLLESTFVNSTTMTAKLLSSFPAGTYPVEVSDPANGAAITPTSLTILAPTATPRPTSEPQPIPTLAIPTAVPGKPLLITRNFSTSTNSLNPGDAVTLTFEVVNQGNQPALGVSVALATGSKFLPANGQASATLPDIFPGAVTTVSLTVNAALDTTSGPNNIPLTLTYRDPEGEVINSSVNLSVNIVAENLVAQVMIARYRYVPDIIQPDNSLTVTLLITNSGSETANGIMVTLGKEGVLLPGLNGDSVAVGDLAPNESRAVDIPLIVKPDAKPGMQSQPMTIRWRGSAPEAIEVSSAITIEISKATVQAPLILLQSYEVKVDGKTPEFLSPGQRFTLNFTIENRGNAPLQNVLVAFGTVETTGGDSGSGSGGTGSGSGTGSGTGSGSSTTIQPSVLFAPLGSGGALFVDTLAAGGNVQLSQEFIVNGTTKSGIYALPISLTYRNAEGADAKTSLSASMVVVALPRLQLILPAPMPEEAYTGEPLPLSVTVKNVSGAIVRLVGYEVTATNSDIMEGATGVLSNLPVDDETSINAMVIPNVEGEVEITLTLRYMDDLNQTRELKEVYTVQITEAPVFEPPPMEEIPVEETPAAPEPPSLGRILLALLGLGS